MKFGTTTLLALLVVTDGFVPNASVKKGSELNNYRVSKWAPQSTAVATKPREGPSMAELAQQWSAQSTVQAVSPAPVSSSPKQNYSGVKWSPNGSTNSFATSAAASPAAADAPPLQTAAAVNTGVKKNYAPTKWSPRSGTSPVATETFAAPVDTTSSFSVAAPPTMSYGGMPKASAGPKGRYSPTKWQPKGGSAAPAAAASGSTSSISAPASSKKKDYSMTKWSPRGGASTGSGWAAPPAVGTFSSAPSAYSAPAAASTATSAPPKNYSGVKWSPRG